MKTEIKKQAPAFTLYGGQNWDGNGREKTVVSKIELFSSSIGEKWSAINQSNCARGEYNEYAELVYKNNNGVAVLFTGDGTTNDPDPEYYEYEPKLVWFELKGDTE